MLLAFTRGGARVENGNKVSKKSKIPGLSINQLIFRDVICRIVIEYEYTYKK